MPRYLGPEDVFGFREVSDPQLSPDARRVAFVVARPDRERDRDVGHVWVVPAAGGDAVQWTFGQDGERSPRWSPGRFLAFLAARDEPGRAQVWALDAAGGEARGLTSLPHGVGAFEWSPAGDRIACVAETRPEARSPAEEAAPIVVRRLRYKADGQGLRGETRAHLFAVDVPAGASEPAEAVQLTDGDFSVTTPAWSPDGAEVAFAAARHDDRDLDLASHLFAAPAAGGEARRITQGGGTASHPAWTGDGRIVFVGTAAGTDLMATLWSVPAAGGEAVPLLEGFDRTVMVGGGPAYPGAPPRIGPGGRSILFCARDRGCVHVYELPLDGGAPVRRLGDDDAVVSGMSAACGVIAAAMGTSEHPPDVVALDGGGERRLTFVNDELLAGVTVVRPERRTFTAADGCAVEALVYLPSGARGPAPLLMDIHGGPHNAIGPVLWPAHLAWQELAGRGWCVVAPNPRGSDGYGLRFMEGVRGGWGVADMQDFVAVVDGLVADGVADPDRLAVTGYSYGGFMTGWLVGHTNRFRRAAAGGVVSDLVSAYGTSDEGAYLGLLAVGGELHEAWDAFDARSPIRSAGSIETPLLILHGERDDRCDIGQAEQLFATLRRRRREVELVRYPGASHTFIVSGRPSHRADYQRRVVDWVTRDGAEGDAR